MKTFSFNLEKLLRLREFEEKNAKTDLAAAISEVDRIKVDLNAVGAECLRVNKTRNANMDLNALIASEHYVNRLYIRKEELLENLAAAELLTEQKRGLFKTAMQKRSVLDKLKEKRFSAWRKEKIKSEESDLEDSARNRK